MFRLLDRDTGLIHFVYRDYDPATAHFIQPDPLGYAAGDVEVYGWCLDDPVNLVDPLGLEANSLCVGGDLSFLGRSVGGDLCYNTDSEGGNSITGTYRNGSSLGAGVNVGVSRGKYSAQTVDELKGQSGYTGGGVSLEGIGFSGKKIEAETYTGTEFGVGASVGTPAEISTGREVTSEVYRGNVSESGLSPSKEKEIRERH